MVGRVRDPTHPQPSRADVKGRWQALLDGQVTRCEVHEWASPWVEEWDALVVDPMIRTGLQHLHGFDLTYDSESPSVVRHGMGKHYVHSRREIADALARWEATCSIYDSDPVAYLRQVKERATSELEEGD